MSAFTYTAALFSLISLLPSALAGPTAGTTYSVSPNQHPSMCLAPANNWEGADVVLKDCDEDDTTWLWTGQSFQNTATDLCIDIRDYGAWSGNKAQVWGCFSYNTNQQFTVEESMIHWDNFCWDLTDGSSSAGTMLQIWSCYSYNDNQQWTLTEIEEVDECDATSVTETATIMSTATASVSDLSTATASVSASNITEAVTATESLTASVNATDPFFTASATDSGYQVNATASATYSSYDVNATASATDSGYESINVTASATESGYEFVNATASATLSAETSTATNSSIGEGLWSPHKSSSVSSDDWSSETATRSNTEWWATSTGSDSWASATASASNPGQNASQSDSWNATSTASNPWETASSSQAWNETSTDSWGASATATATESGSYGNATSTSTSSAITATATVGTISSGYLQTSGTKIVDSDGNEVILRGTNIGGWLVLEDWMCGITDTSGSSDRFSLSTLENRFGTDQARTLVEAWAENWLTTSDFDELAAIGFNVIRLPFSFRTVQNADGSWRDDAFTRMDWAISQAKARGIYTIVDFHMWSGQEADYSAISENTDEGQSQRDAAGEIWKKVATHYLGESSICAFDVINEPTGSYGDYLQQDLYNAVRSVDANRIIIHESISTDPSTYGWTNVIYSLHEYDMMGSDLSSNQATWTNGVQAYIDLWHGYNIPFMLAEFMADGETLDYMLNSMNSQGISWLTWAHSTVNMGRWGIWNHEAFNVDVSSDSYDTIYSAWTNMPSTFHTSIYDQMKTAATGSTNVSSRKRDLASAARATKRFHGSHGGRSRRNGMAHAVRGAAGVSI